MTVLNPYARKAGKVVNQPIENQHKWTINFLKVILLKNIVNNAHKEPDRNILVQRALGMNRNIIFQKSALGKQQPELPKVVCVNSRSNITMNGAQCNDSDR